jgi:hypothetical protein
VRLVINLVTGLPGKQQPERPWSGRALILISSENVNWTENA